ncbi:MAG: GtrA family protein [Flavobacteriales bacterium]|nr:GtrA family protein [Flavobacteriales bacterium]MCX7649533.1 GtrA family protein [Flavobacteriales bacterium]MDW8431246.1 GtrA family protein [Flavobacteriales bacterium]
MKHLAKKFIKFGIVGFTGVLIDFGITWVLKELLFLNPYVANSAGFLCAASNNWLLNRIWTFRNRHPRILKQYLVFMLVSLMGLGLNNAVVWLGVSFLALNFYVAKVVAVGVVMFWNFIINYKFTFAQSSGS